MIGTLDGYWYSFAELTDGRVDLTIHKLGEEVACARVPFTEVDDVFDVVVANRRFNALLDWARRYNGPVMTDAERWRWQQDWVIG